MPKGASSKIKILASIFSLLALGACNTFSGMGKDISTSADWAKGKMNGQDSANSQPKSTTQPKTDSNQQNQPTK
jgi:predicted small secreted protein